MRYRTDIRFGIEDFICNYTFLMQQQFRKEMLRSQQRIVNQICLDQRNLLCFIASFHLSKD